MLYYCKPANVIIAVHDDAQLLTLDRTVYGSNIYIVVDYNGSPSQDPNTKQYKYPTITPTIQKNSVSIECRYRILFRISEQSQRNMTSYTSDLNSVVSTGGTLTSQQITDLQMATAIHNWIGSPERPASSMLGTSDSLVATNDLEWYLDVKWPPWNSAWSAFVARF